MPWLSTAAADIAAADIAAVDTAADSVAVDTVVGFAAADIAAAGFAEDLAADTVADHARHIEAAGQAEVIPAGALEGTAPRAVGVVPAMRDVSDQGAPPTVTHAAAVMRHRGAVAATPGDARVRLAWRTAGQAADGTGPPGEAVMQALSAERAAFRVMAVPMAERTAGPATRVSRTAAETAPDMATARESRTRPAADRATA